jgi:glycosyltransferase involved in cell wall biosynthesis
MKKKVLYLITKSNWGGAQRYVFDLATNLLKDQFESVVAFGGTGEVGGAPGILQEKLAAANVRTIFIPSLTRDVSWVKEFLVWRDLTRLMRAERPDVVHLNSSKAAAWGAFVAFMVGAPRVIFTVHGWPFKEHRNFIATYLIKEISRFTGILSDAVIVVSKEDQEIGKRMWGLKKKVRYVPLALAPSNEMYTREQIEAFLFSGASGAFKNADTIRLVTIAEMTPNKGLVYGIEMMSILEKNAPGKFKYMIIGKGEEHSLLSKMVGEKKLAGSVCFANFLPSNKPQLNLESEASQCLPAFDIFILPSIKEGMPYVLLEAAMAGLPIVASDVVKTEASNLPNIHFVLPRSGAALASQVEKISQNFSAHKSTATRSFPGMLTETIDIYTTAPTISVSSRA